MSLNPNFRPSCVEKCVLCPGNLKMCEGIPRTDSPAASEGTMLHEKVAKHTTEGLTSEQQIMVERCFELMERLAPNGKWTHEIELSMVGDDFEEILKGTADAVIVLDNPDALMPDHVKKGLLLDWKFGYNPVTSADENWQGMTYASMMFQQFDIESCDVIFFQPRLGNKGFSKATFTREDLADFPAKLKEIYGFTQDGLMLKAGNKQCKYCDAKPNCPEYKRFTGQVSDSVAKIEHTHSLTTDELRKALEQTAQVKDFIKQLESQVSNVENVARERLMQNLVTPDDIGYQLKTRKGARKCVNPQEVFNLLMDVIPIDKFMSVVDVSIPNLEALYGKEAKAKGMYKSQKEAVKVVNEIIAPFIDRKQDSFTLEKVGE